MSTIKTPEQQLKISKNPDVQFKVKKAEEYIEISHPNLSNTDINIFARSKIADRIRLQRLRKKNAELIKDSEIDEMTELITAVKFKKNLFAEMLRMKRTGKEGVVVVLDLNNLKVTNDTLGHEAGNKLIKETAQILKGESRSTDYIGREEEKVGRGGAKSDEFYVLLSETDMNGAEIWWKRTNEELQNKGIKISAGVSKINPNETVEEVIHKADTAMYKAKEIAKETGSNQMIKYNQLKAA